MKITYKQLVDICDKEGWLVYPSDNTIDLRKSSPAGEDFGFSIDKDKDYIEQIEQYADDFDPQEHAESWIQLSKQEKEQMGVPSTFTLVDDAKDIQKMLFDLVNAVNGLV